MRALVNVLGGLVLLGLGLGLWDRTRPVETWHELGRVALVEQRDVLWVFVEVTRRFRATGPLTGGQELEPLRFQKAVQLELPGPRKLADHFAIGRAPLAEAVPLAGPAGPRLLRLPAAGRPAELWEWRAPAWNPRPQAEAEELVGQAAGGAVVPPAAGAPVAAVLDVAGGAAPPLEVRGVALRLRKADRAGAARLLLEAPGLADPLVLHEVEAQHLSLDRAELDRQRAEAAAAAAG